MRLKAALLFAVLGKFLVSGVLPNLFQVGGLALVGIGFFVLAPWLGFIVTGLLCALVGWALDRGR